MGKRSKWRVGSICVNRYNKIIYEIVDEYLDKWNLTTFKLVNSDGSSYRFESFMFIDSEYKHLSNSKLGKVLYGSKS